MVKKYPIIKLHCAPRSFVDGMARVVDVGGTLNHYHPDDLMAIFDELRTRRQTEPSGTAAEIETVRIVWDSVGQCIREAIGRFEDEDSYGHMNVEQLE